jgi:hypothetical protein
MVVMRLAGVLALMAAMAVPALPPAEPIVSIWYRGSPAGQPRLDDLAAIRAVGFTGVTWPLAQADRVTALREMAATVGLAVVVRPAPRVVSGDRRSAAPDAYVDVPVSGDAVALIPARAWRAVAAGARTFSFDPEQQEGTGLTTPGGQTPAWVAPAVALARQLSANAALVERLKPGPPVTIDPPAPGVEVVMLDGDSSWIIVATSIGAARHKIVASLMSGVPYGLWVSWLDGTDLSMLSTPNGPRWTFEIAPGQALVYIIGKRQR